MSVPNPSQIDLEMGLQRRFHLSSAARVRPEGFGGLAYIFQNQKLFFIAPTLMPFVKAQGETVAQVIAQIEAEAGKKLSQKSLVVLLLKLEDLKEKGVLDEQQ